MAYEYELIDLSVSSREEFEDSTHLTKTYLVVHAEYQYGTANKLGSCDVDACLLATKESDSDGEIVSVTQGDELPSYNDLRGLIDPIIQSQIKTDILNTSYREIVLKKVATAQADVASNFKQPSKSK